MRLLKVNNTVSPKVWGSFFDELLNESWKDGSWGTLSKVPANIHETKDGYHLEISAPGLKKEDISIAVEKDLLTISFEKKGETSSEDYKTIRREFSAESFKRSFTLSDKINPETIQAKYEDGILKVHVAKREEVQPSSRQISIS